jgi:1-acyl-sn-glycerol-3-phosphate acyltransferase
LFYRLVRFVLVGFCRVYLRMTVEGTDNVPLSGPYVIAPVHRSNLDTLIAAGVTPRRVRFMGKDSLWKHPWPGKVLSSLGAFAVHRGSADREALRRCGEVLEEGEPLVIFPEGTRQSGPIVQELYDGVAYVAAKAGVPILPVGIGGSEDAMPSGSKLIHPVKVHVVVGKPIAPPTAEPGKRVSRRAVQETTRQLHEELQRLFDQAQTRAHR